MGATKAEGHDKKGTLLVTGDQSQEPNIAVSRADGVSVPKDTLTAPLLVAGKPPVIEPVAKGRIDQGWSPEEASRLRKAVKRMVKQQPRPDKGALWLAVSDLLGGSRSPTECKAQYRKDYREHKGLVAGSTRSSSQRKRSPSIEDGHRSGPGELLE